MTKKISKISLFWEHLHHIRMFGACFIFFFGGHGALANQIGEPLRLSIPNGPDAFYYMPTSKGLKPVLMYLHGRGGYPGLDCKKWASAARYYGWVVCPQGPEDRGGGARGWASNPAAASQIMDQVVSSLRAKYKGRVQTKHNILIGFSEGAFVAQQVGLKEPEKWNRWLILAASDKYWDDHSLTELREVRSKVHKVYLLTGEQDGVAMNTKATAVLVKKAKIPVKVNIVPNLGHEVAVDRMRNVYGRSLAWLSR